MADGRRRTHHPPADPEAPPASRVARLDEIAGTESGTAGRTGAPVARLGEVSAEAPAPAVDGPVTAAGPHRSAPPGAGAPADLGQIGTAAPASAPPVADLAAAAPTPGQAVPGQAGGRPAGGSEPGGAPVGGQDEHGGAGGRGAGPVALLDSASLGVGREEMPVAELGPVASNGRAGRGGRVGPPAGGSRDRPDTGRRRRRASSSDVPEAPVRDPAGTAGPTGPGRQAAEVAAQSGRPGRPRGRGREELDPDADPVAIAREICLRLLTDRSRTRQELAQALRRKGVPDEVAHSVLERFDHVGLIDDAAFAGQWVRSRHTHRGLARRAIAVELRRKGVSDEDAGEALAGVDAESEERRARELVDRKLRSLAVGTAEQRAAAGRRLVGMLARKGYGAGVAYRVVKEALAERGAEADELGDGEVPDD
jgi:regulatory protein